MHKKLSKHIQRIGYRKDAAVTNVWDYKFPGGCRCKEKLKNGVPVFKYCEYLIVNNAGKHVDEVFQIFKNKVRNPNYNECFHMMVERFTSKNWSNVRIINNIITKI